VIVHWTHIPRSVAIWEREGWLRRLIKKIEKKTHQRRN